MKKQVVIQAQSIRQMEFSYVVEFPDDVTEAEMKELASSMEDDESLHWMFDEVEEKWELGNKEPQVTDEVEGQPVEIIVTRTPLGVLIYQNAPN